MGNKDGISYRPYIVLPAVLAAAVLLWALYSANSHSRPNSGVYDTQPQFRRTHPSRSTLDVAESLQTAAAALAAAGRALAVANNDVASSSFSSIASNSTLDFDMRTPTCECQAGNDSSSKGSGSAGAGSSSSSTTTDNSTVHELVVPDYLSSDKDFNPDVARKMLELEKQGKGRKIISMSLYGNDTRYTIGAVENALMVKRGWPGWTLRLYFGDGVPADILDAVRALGAELIPVNTFASKASSTMWRFFVIGDRSVTRFIVRDVDARLTPRDFHAVKEWMSTKRLFHIIRDDVFHGNPILAGMWGSVSALLHPRMLQPFQLVETNATAGNAKYKWGVDQEWLAKVVHPAVKNHTLLHASWYCRKYDEAEWRGMPTKRVHDRDFIGNVYWGMNDFQGRQCTAPATPPDTPAGECPKECRRRQEWTMC